MNRKVLVVLLVAVVAVLAANFGPYLVREIGHARHYKELKHQGQYDAKFVELTVEQPAKGSSTVRVKAVVQNAGTQSWPQGQHYFALGIFGRTSLGARDESKLAFKEGEGQPPNRLVIHRDIKPQETWETNFSVILPQEPGEHTFYLQPVWEGVTWLGEEREVKVTVE